MFEDFCLQIILTIAEHHSAIVPWQIVAQKTGAILKFVSLDENEVPDVEKLREMISTRTKLVVVHHVSNVLGRFLFTLTVPVLLVNTFKENKLIFFSSFHHVESLASIYIFFDELNLAKFYI